MNELKFHFRSSSLCFHRLHVIPSLQISSCIDVSTHYYYYFISGLFFFCLPALLFNPSSSFSSIHPSFALCSALGQIGEDVDIMWPLSSWWSPPLVLPLLSLLVGISCSSSLLSFSLLLSSTMYVSFFNIWAFPIFTFEIQTFFYLNVACVLATWFLS